MANAYYTLITGASEGLGKFLALECARRRRNLVLSALPGSGLRKLAAYITGQYGVHVVYVEKDLSTEKSCYELVAAIREKGLAINCLVNNAGIGGSFGFDEKDVPFYHRQIGVNVVAPTILSRLLVADLRRHAPSHILNISSLAGFFALPNKQVYGATKAYLFRFSKSLRTELKQDNIHVSVLCPGGMDTRWELLLEHRMGANWLCRQSIMHPAKVAAIALDSMLQNKAVIVPGAWNRVFLLWNRIFPGWLKTHLVRYQTRKHSPLFAPVPAEPAMPLVAV
ncbi:SDR family NAD(P)-dependent oxidoreductase [Flavisolibacter sp. BT320]|nr:SDR family NAD(P)-dependent oxidoreductase [Flavisolibacter longurius]